MLLLGAGESGKSTFAKQMRIIHMQGFTQEERDYYKGIIKSNILFSIKTLIEGAKELELSIGSQNQEFAGQIETMGEMDFDNSFLDFVPQIKELWIDEVIQQTYDSRSKFQVLDSCKYYLDELDRIAESNYSPNEQDILRARVKTTGIMEIEFKIDNVNFKLMDVGGQRSERRKWINCFDGVTAVLFCVALSEYDLMLYEDHTVNRMQESLKLFDEICNAPCFDKTSMILFLNKKDIFEEKIKRVPITVCFDDYSGSQNFDESSTYIRNKFLSLNNNPKEKTIYPHITTATDTENIKFVFDAIHHILITNALAATGL